MDDDIAVYGDDELAGLAFDRINQLENDLSL